MNHCFHCGNKLTALVTACGWLGRYRCDHCQQRYQLTYGDNKTSSDSFQFMGSKPFKIETPIVYAGHGETPQAIPKTSTDEYDLGF
jgi:hypothetical protein